MISINATDTKNSLSRSSISQGFRIAYARL